MMMTGVEPSRTCVVLGGRGFIGRHLLVRLLKLGGWIVRVADSAPSLQLDPSEFDSHPLSQALSIFRASYFQVDVRNKTTIINGAKNVITACRQCKVKRLIYNSTADVFGDTTLVIHNGDESLLYASSFGNAYIDLKAQAEALALFDNDIDGLLTCTLQCFWSWRQAVNAIYSGYSKIWLGKVNVRSTFITVAHIWNKVGYITRTLAQGDGWNLFFKAISVPYINFIWQNLVTATAVAPVFSFTTFMVYEKYEEEIDGLVEVLYSITRKAVVPLLRKPYSS